MLSHCLPRAQCTRLRHAENCAVSPPEGCAGTIRQHGLHYTGYEQTGGHLGIGGYFFPLTLCVNPACPEGLVGSVQNLFWIYLDLFSWCKKREVCVVWDCILCSALANPDPLLGLICLPFSLPPNSVPPFCHPLPPTAPPGANLLALADGSDPSFCRSCQL